MQPGSGPVSVQPYWYPYWQKTEIKHLVKDLLTSGIIKPSNSPNLSPVFLIEKHDGSWCMCVDYRSLNKLTIKDKFLIPIIDKLLDELHGTQHSSKLWSMKWVPSGSCFCLDDRHFKFLVMPLASLMYPPLSKPSRMKYFKHAWIDSS